MIMIVIHLIKDTDVRKISFFLVVLLVGACVSCVSCMTEIKPVLKARELSIPQRIVEQQDWLDQDIAAKAMTAKKAKPIRAKLKQIKTKYDRLQTAGTLTQEDSKAINRMLDETSEKIFRSSMKTPGIRVR
jgi:septal ring factor EnvC (AmiA/AmiB activator)